MQQIKCEFFTSLTGAYECKVDSTAILDGPCVFVGNHHKGITNRDVKGLLFRDIYFSKFPRGLRESFPNLEWLLISKSNLETIDRDDIKMLTTLRQFSIANCRLKRLKGDLFRDLTDLEVISFKGNELEEIEPDILDGLEKLTFVNFRENPNIHFLYKKSDGWFTLDDLKREIAEKCKPKVEKRETMEAAVEELTNELEEFRAIFSDDAFKDFTFIVGSSSFKVHKTLFAARSRTLAEIFRKNPTAVAIELQEVTVETFEAITDFIYTKQLPATANTSEVVSAAAILKIDSLLSFSVARLITEIDEKNAFDVLVMANKINDENLRAKAFSTIKTKIFPEKQLEDGLSKQPQKLKTLIEMKIKFEKECDVVLRDVRWNVQ
jgi:hypothetical protein